MTLSKVNDLKVLLLLPVRDRGAFPVLNDQEIEVKLRSRPQG